MVIDGIIFSDLGLLKCTPTIEIRCFANSTGVSTTSGTAIRDIQGTYINYDITLDFKSYSIAEASRLYDVLTAPVEYHTFSLPYAGNWRTFQGYIDGFALELLDMYDIQRYDSVSLTIKARTPYKRAVI